MKQILIIVILLVFSLQARILPDTVVGLTILVDFPDEPATIDHSVVEDMLNGDNFTENDNYGSMYQYYKENSNNKFHYKNIVTDYIGVSGNILSYDVFDTTLHSAQVLIKEALDKLELSGFDFSTITTANGEAVALNVLYAGNFRSKSYALFPHQDFLDNTPVHGGITFNQYQITNIGNEPEVGFIVHENGHLLFEWPDLYASVDQHSYGVGYYSLMSTTNAKIPQPPNPYFKFLAGWIDTVDITGVPYGSEYTLYPNDTVAYVYRKNNHYPDDNTGYFFLEYKKKEGWSSSIPDEGLAVWRIYTNGDNSFKANPNFVDLVQADGLDDLGNRVNRGDDGDLFKTGDILNDTTSPDVIWYTNFGNYMSFFNLFDISVYDEYLTFKTGSIPVSIVQSEEVIYQGEYFYVPELLDVNDSILPSGDLQLIHTNGLGGIAFKIDSTDFGVVISDVNYLYLYKSSSSGIRVRFLI